MNKCRLRVEQQVADILFRDSNIDKESHKAYIKGNVLQHLGEGAVEKVNLLVDMTMPEKYKIQAEVWMFSREDLLELLNSNVVTRNELYNRLIKEARTEHELLQSQELIKFEEL